MENMTILHSSMYFVIFYRASSRRHQDGSAPRRSVKMNRTSIKPSAIIAFGHCISVAVTAVRNCRENKLMCLVQLGF